MLYQWAEKFVQTMGTWSLGIFVLFAGLNWFCLFDNLVRKRNASMIPIFGSFFGVVGCLLLPPIRRWAWLPPLLDPGTYAVAQAIHGLIREAWQTSRFNLAFRYEGRRGIHAVELRLFRAGVFTIRHTFDRPKGEPGITIASSIGEWNRTENRLHLRIGEKLTVLEGVPGADGRVIRQAMGFASIEEAPWSLDDIELTLQPGR